jgi:hypothetical protein
MAVRKILIIDGHPDPDPARFVGARPVARTITGSVAGDQKHCREWLDEMEALDKAGE